MDRYSEDICSIDSSRNQLLLRKDIHFNMNRLDWTIFPYGSHWVFYALNNSPEIAAQFHSKALRPIEGVQPPYLLAAFARAVFPSLNQFLRSRTDKYLIGKEVSTDAAEGKKCSGQWCFDAFLPPGHRGRSASPTKRGSPTKSESPSKRQRNGTAPAEPGHPQDNRNQSSSPLDIPEGKRDRSSGSNSLSSEGDQSRAPKRWKSKFHNTAFDGPCICKTLPPSPSATLSRRSSQDGVIQKPFNLCLSDHCRTRKDTDRLDRIRQERLATERARSDPEGLWEAEIEWAKDPAAIEDLDRWLWVRGQEVLDDDGEHIDTTIGAVMSMQ
ncbi:MAG: hypothetical protein Q9211_000592 [Gyalolechia sp. 1 TL-2023]